MLESVRLTSVATAMPTDQPDLFGFRALLVSTGPNLNGDFFEAGETWKARYSPLNKPINIEHNRDRPVGHIVGVDAGAHPFDGPAPGMFGLFVGAVVYRRVADAKLQWERDKLIEDVAANGLTPSMSSILNPS